MGDFRGAHSARVPFSAARRKADAAQGKRQGVICTPRPQLAFGGPPNAASGPDALPGFLSRARAMALPSCANALGLRPPSQGAAANSGIPRLRSPCNNQL